MVALLSFQQQDIRLKAVLCEQSGFFCERSREIHCCCK
jgi:hypothetical protein